MDPKKNTLLFRVNSYIKFLVQSKNQHGVHSPFVFDLLTKCLYKKEDKVVFTPLNSYRSDLRFNPKIIEVNDFGAGSKVFSSNQRKVSQIAKHVGISKKRSHLLFKLVKYFQPGFILEVGTSLGIATAALSMANPNSRIITLEGCDETANIAQSMFKKYELDNIELIRGDFSKTYPKAIKKHKFDLIFFDGNHTKKATLDYFENCLSYTHNDSILIFDDIHWSPEMEEAWKEIKNHPEVTVTIDTYQWGLVFLRKEQQKEHFIIRV